MQSNSIKIAILDLLRVSQTPLSVYQIIIYLKDKALLEHQQGNLALFRLNFLVMNALYQLQQELMNESLYLTISALSIYIEPMQAMHQTQLTNEYLDGELRDYYLDWSNLSDTSEQDVDALLKSFWNHFLSQDKQMEALVTLGVSAGSDWSVIQQAYRRLAVLHHPDKGGDPQRFIEVREAYEILQKSYKTCTTNC